MQEGHGRLLLLVREGDGLKCGNCDFFMTCEDKCYKLVDKAKTIECIDNDALEL